MLVILRRYQKYILMVVAVVVIVTFVFWGSQTGDDSPRMNRESPGKIYGSAVSHKDFMDAFWGVYLGYFLQSGQSPDTGDRRVAAQLEQMAWLRLVQVRKVEELGLYVPVDRAIEFIQQSPAFRSKAGFDADRYKQFIHGRLPGLRMAEKDLIRIAREQLAIEQLKDIIASTAKATHLEVRNAYSDAGQKIGVAVVAFSATNYTAQVKLADKDIEDYFNKHKETYRIPDRAKVRYVKISVDSFLPKVTVTDAEIRDRYEKDKETFADPATQKPKPLEAVRDEIRKAIAAPRAMNLVREQAEKINDEVLPDPRNPQEKRPDLAAAAQKHGLALADTDFFAEKDELKYASTPNFQRAALSLSSDSPYEVVGAPDGAYLLQFVARKPSELPTLTAVRAKVVADLTRERALELCRKDGREKRDKFKPQLTAIQPGQKPAASLEQLAAAAGLKAVTPAPFSLEDSPPGLPYAGLVQRACVSLASGELSDFIETAEGGFIVQLKQRITPDEKELAKQEPAIRNRLLYGERFFGFGQPGKRDIAYDAWLGKQAAEANIQPRRQPGRGDEEE